MGDGGVEFCLVDAGLFKCSLGVEPVPRKKLGEPRRLLAPLSDGARPRWIDEPWTSFLVEDDSAQLERG